MILSYLRNRRRKRLQAEPFPSAWVALLEKNIALYSLLSETEKQRLQNILRVLVAEKHWEGCGGLVMTDEIRVTIAGQAALLLLGIDHDYFERVLSILVYLSGYRSPEGWTDNAGVIHADNGRLAEAWYDGPIVLAWDAVVRGAQNPRDGRNVVLHEFAHQLDFMDGVIDGTPPLKNAEQAQRWLEVMTAEFAALKAESERGRPRVLDKYGASAPEEFFAVATECFFEKPLQMQEHHPRLYHVLKDYYQQDPVKWFRGEQHGETSSKQRTRRCSRAVVKATVHAQKSFDWPAWVTWWDLHPGLPRLYPMGFVENLAIFSIAMLLLLAVAYLSAGSAGLNTGAPIVLLSGLLLYGLVSWIWLRLAVRWVDRHGVWAGQAMRHPTAVQDDPTDK